MAYSYSPGKPDDEDEEKRRGIVDNENAEQRQPDATLPRPDANADAFARNSTGVEGNPETRYGAVVQSQPAQPQRTAIPDAFDSAQSPIARAPLLVPSPAVSVAPPAPAITTPQSATPLLRAPVPTAGPIAPTVTPSTSLTVPPAAPQGLNPVSVSLPPVAPVSPTPFSGTLPGVTPRPNAQPVTANPFEEDDEAYRRRLAVA